MLDADLAALLPALERFHARFSMLLPPLGGASLEPPVPARPGAADRAQDVENIAEQVGAPPRKLQEFLSNSPWDDEGCIGKLQRFVGEALGAPGGVLVLDDTGFPKKGIHSAGVARQYPGTLGRVDNCQVGVFLGYASPHGHTLVDRRLYLAQSWLADPAKRSSPRAAVPEEVVFRTKLELAGEMLTAAIARGDLPCRVGDRGRRLRREPRPPRAGGRSSAAGTSSRSGTAEPWTADPDWAVPPRAGRKGRRRTRARPRTDGIEARPVVDEIVHRCRRCLDPPPRHRGREGPREYEFARLRVIEKRHRAPGPRAGCWPAVQSVRSRPTRSSATSRTRQPRSRSPRWPPWAACAGRSRTSSSPRARSGSISTRSPGSAAGTTTSPSHSSPSPSSKPSSASGGKGGDLASVPEIRQLLERLPVERWTAGLAIAWWQFQQRRKAAARAATVGAGSGNIHHASNRRCHTRHPWRRIWS